jgi:hypothetical protein
LYIKTGETAEKESHFERLDRDRGLYIKMDLFSSITVLLGLAVLLDVFGVSLPILFQVTGVLGQPFFDALIIILAAVGILPSPVGIGLNFAGFFTGGRSAGLLSAAHAGVGAEGTFAVGAFSLFHPGPLSGLELKESNQSQKLEDQDEKKKRIILLPGIRGMIGGTSYIGNKGGELNRW